MVENTIDFRFSLEYRVRMRAKDQFFFFFLTSQNFNQLSVQFSLVAQLCPTL